MFVYGADTLGGGGSDSWVALYIISTNTTRLFPRVVCYYCLISFQTNTHILPGSELQRCDFKFRVYVELIVGELVLNSQYALFV